MKLAAQRQIAGLFLVCGAAALLGCGDSDRVSVTGKVEWQNGAPLAGATVVARSSATGKSVRGQTDAEGRFTLGSIEVGDGVPPGDYDVIILEDRGDPEHPRPKTVPAKYEHPTNSGIKLTVKPGEDAVLNVTLDAPGPSGGGR